MHKGVRILTHVPFIGRAALIPFRAKAAMDYYWKKLGYLIVWLFRSREVTNWSTYDLTESNKRHLASIISLIAGQTPEEITRYFDELESDQALIEHLRRTTQNSPDGLISDLNFHYGRRLGWYAIVRAMKPRVVVETGVDKGLGSCVLTAALMHNRQEGHDGFYYGTDIDPHAGYLLTGRYREFGEILFGDSIASLQSMNAKIDVFINDSDHSSDYERREYEVVSEKLSDEAIILGDNAHCTDELWEFARKSGRMFLFFQESPSKHWYPGAGIGFAFKRERLEGRGVDRIGIESSARADG